MLTHLDLEVERMKGLIHDLSNHVNTLLLENEMMKREITDLKVFVKGEVS